MYVDIYRRKSPTLIKLICLMVVSTVSVLEFVEKSNSLTKSKINILLKIISMKCYQIRTSRRSSETS